MEGARIAIKSVWIQKTTPLLCGLVFLFVGCRDEKLKSLPHLEIRKLNHEFHDTSRTSYSAQEWVGVFLPSETVDIRVEIDGGIDRMYARPGDNARQGQILATLDTTVLERIVRAELAAVRIADGRRRKAELEKTHAELELDRSVELGVLLAQSQLELNKNQHESKKLDVGIAEAEYEQAIARLQTAKDDLERATLRAPFDCIVAARYTDSPALVSKGNRVFRVFRANEWLVRFAVFPEETDLLLPGTLVIAESPSRTTRATGVVENIMPEIDPASQMVFLEAPLSGDLSIIRAGTVASVYRKDTTERMKPLTQSHNHRKSDIEPDSSRSRNKPQ